MANPLLIEILEWTDAVIMHTPGRIGSRIRRHWLRRRLKLAEFVYTSTGCKFVGGDTISLSGVTTINAGAYFNAMGGSIRCTGRVSFNSNVHINAAVGGNISIGDGCMIGPGVVMRTANHSYQRTDVYIWDQGHDLKDITLEEDCWLGANVIILGGVRIGRGAVIGAGAVVTKDIPPLAVAVGVPAAVIKYRGEGA